ncbi:mannosyl-3-phosphoglycerate synthase [Desulfothermus okinawensis JCM 13304]
MRIETFRYTERLGAVLLRDVQKVIELDSGLEDTESEEARGVLKVSESTIHEMQRQMVIVIPTKNEKLRLFENCISGIPHECLKIIVSNSDTRPINRFELEKETLQQFCEFSKRRAIIVHQKDPIISRALQEAGYDDLLDQEGMVRDGKAEGMIIGILLTKFFNKDFIGFIDADNYFPGTVLEYARAYAAGLNIAKYEQCMVRILWRYKPKIHEQGLYFKRWGRVSEITNRCLNSLISFVSGFETDVIKTGNAGEHAMSLSLAESIPYASGYAIEPQELLSLFEEYGDIPHLGNHKNGFKGIEILQIETRNPHLHENKGQEHINNMLLASLGSIYHSEVCPEETKNLILEELQRQGLLKLGDEPPRPKLIRAPKEINFERFKEIVGENIERYIIK